MWLVILSLCAVCIFGFFLMDKLDKFIGSTHFFPDNHEPVKEIHTDSVLVFGVHAISKDIVNLFKEYNIPYHQARNMDDFDISTSFKYVVAVDESDLENLMICVITEKAGGVIKRIAICNNIENAKIFKDKLIPFVDVSGATAEETVHRLFFSQICAQ